jgi:hypothetical protein
MSEKGDGVDAPDGICVPECRCSAATRFVRAGLDLDDVATILGWRREKVEQIAFRYVTASEVGLALANRLNGTKPDSRRKRL